MAIYLPGSDRLSYADDRSSKGRGRGPAVRSLPEVVLHSGTGHAVMTDDR